MKPQFSSRLLLTPAALLLAVLLGLPGCGENAPPEPPAPPAVVGDRTPARRIVSLAPSVTAWVEALGAGDRLVGVSQYCQPATTPRPRDVGRIDRPNLEVITELAPDAILATTMTPVREIERMRGLGWRVLVFDHESLDGMFESVDLMGAVTENEATAGETTEAIRQALRAAAYRPDLPDWRAVVLLDTDPAYAAGPGSFPYELVQGLGLPQVTDGLHQPWPHLGREAIVHLNPQVVILSAGPGRSDPEQLRAEWDKMRAGPVWSQTDAGKHDRLIIAEQNALTVPGPGFEKVLGKIVRMLETLQQAETENP